MNNLDRQNTFKVTTLGSSGVGKTTILNYLSTGKCSPSYGSTIGACFSTYKKTITINSSNNQSDEALNTQITLELWDTAGQERFNSLIPLYLKNADVILLVYDVTDSYSFNRLKECWLVMIEAQKNMVAPNVIIGIIGNKIDLTDRASTTPISEILVSSDPKFQSIIEGKRLADQYGFKFYLTSPFKEFGIMEAFGQLIKELALTTPYAYQHNISIVNLDIDNKSICSPKSGCCGY